jgi:two-component system CheB/CheR fusion protein
VVNADFEILQFRGDTSAYLTPAPGRASLNLLKMLREGLLVGVRAALQQAKRDETPVRQEGLKVRSDGGHEVVQVEVIPLGGYPGRDPGFLVLFEPEAPPRARPPVSRSRSTRADQDLVQSDREIRRLKDELTATREYLQSVIEQQESANEELQSANEEVQSANEELQSVNEELETSKEEVQSNNEELATVNDELHQRNLDLIRSNNDLVNVFASVEMAIVMLGSDLRIRWFTPAAEQTLNLRSTDTNRSILDFKLAIDVPDLEDLLTEVLSQATSRQRELQDRKGRWYSLRVRPYRSAENQIDGVLLLLVDVDSLKRAEESVRAGAERLRITQDQAPVGIREVDAEGHFLRVNDRYCAITGYTRDELLGLNITDLVHSEDIAADLLAHRRAWAGELPSFRTEIRYIHKQGHTIWIELHGFVVRDATGAPQVAVGIAQDVSERKLAEEALRHSEERRSSSATRS